MNKMGLLLRELYGTLFRFLPQSSLSIFGSGHLEDHSK